MLLNELAKSPVDYVFILVPTVELELLWLAMKGCDRGSEESFEIPVFFNSAIWASIKPWDTKHNILDQMAKLSKKGVFVVSKNGQKSLLDYWAKEGSGKKIIKC